MKLACVVDLMTSELVTSCVQADWPSADRSWLRRVCVVAADPGVLEVCLSLEIAAGQFTADAIARPSTGWNWHYSTLADFRGPIWRQLAHWRFTARRASEGAANEKIETVIPDCGASTLGVENQARRRQ